MKKETLIKKKNGFVREDYSINSKRLFFSVHTGNIKTIRDVKRVFVGFIQIIL
jgi:hypothetical protein